MKKITLLLICLITSTVISQTTSIPVYDGTFGGATYNQTFTFPTGAETWAGFANNNTSMYPLAFSNGGKIKFKATVSADAQVYFRFEANPHPNVDPAINTADVSLLASNSADTEYEVVIPTHATNTYNSAIFYVKTRDVDVKISGIKIETFDTDGTTVLKTNFPVYDGTFGGATYSQNFTFPTGAETWAGFANNNTNIYPLSFPSGGKVTFKATVATDAQVYFRFEANPHPNVDPAVNTADVSLLASNSADTAYEVDIPTHATNTYNSAIFYVKTRDVDVKITELKILTNSGLSQIDLPVDFESSTVDYTVTDFGGNSSSLVADPDNASNMVIKAIKTSGAQTWGGTTIGKASGFATAIPFTASERKMVVKVWAASAGIPVRFKVEDSNDAGKSVETEVNTTASGWQNLVFDFNNEATGTAAFNDTYSYNKASIFFNFGTSPAADETYYFDDVVFGSTPLSTNKYSLNNVSLYPNPTENFISISADDIIKEAKIYNVLGKLVKTISINNTSKNINVSNLNSGIYLVKYSVNNLIGTKKFIKN